MTDEHIVVLDATHNAVMKFKETQYGALINDAVGLRFDGDETLAIAKWEEVLRLDENNELANNGIGKAYLTAGDNEKAMHYLEIGMNRKYYSIAWKRLRNEILADNLNYILTGAIILLIGLKIYKVIKRKKTGVQKEGGLL